MLEVAKEDTQNMYMLVIAFKRIVNRFVCRFTQFLGLSVSSEFGFCISAKPNSMELGNCLTKTCDSVNERFEPEFECQNIVSTISS